MARRAKVYEGKTKILYEGPEPGSLIQFFKDDTSAMIDGKPAILAGKGVINNHISEHVFKGLTALGIPNHFMRRVSMREQLIKALEIIPVTVHVRNMAAGSLAKRLGLDDGTPLPRPLIEYYFKSGTDSEPLVNEDHILAFDWANEWELEDMMHYAFRVNDFLSGLFAGINLQLIDLKLEFGRMYEGEDVLTVLADEISPDNCRLWDMKTGERMDRERFQPDMSGVKESYSEIARRFGILPTADIAEFSDHKRKGR